jgi:predicted HicB family RNase H-like nuclease
MAKAERKPVTLRVPRALASRVKAAAAADGISINAWLVRCFQLAVSTARHGESRD